VAEMVAKERSLYAEQNFTRLSSCFVGGNTTAAGSSSVRSMTVGVSSKLIDGFIAAVVLEGVDSSGQWW